MFLLRVIARLIAGLLLVALAIGVLALWPRGEPDTTPSTTVVAVETTRAQSSTSTSTSVLATTSAAVESHVVTTVEEAEEILRELWFGWFEGIYNQDEERIREVVGSQVLLENARSAFGHMDFESHPNEVGTVVFEAEPLRADKDCLAIWAGIRADYRTGSTDGVHVARYTNGRWVLVSLWVHRNDLWEADCDSELESLP